MAKARRVLKRLLAMGWVQVSQVGSHRKLKKADQPMLIFAFHDSEELGPVMLAKLAKHAGCKPKDLI